MTQALPPARSFPPLLTTINGRVTLRTLILIRWVAIFGQLLTVLTVHFVLGFRLPLEPALAAIGASVLLNIAALALRRTKSRLADRDAALYLGYDLLQLSLLLYLTGGLHNPFAVLILAPLTVAATILPRGSVIGLTGLALVCLTALAVWSFPLPWPGGEPVFPTLYTVGIWLALAFSAIFITDYVRRVAQEARKISEALAASQVALAREQQMSALGALAAAAAHELGTPLGTISLVAKELVNDVPPDSPLAEDIRLLHGEALRCRDILAELSRKPEAEGGAPYDRLTLHGLVEAAAGNRPPHVELVIEEERAPGADVPDRPTVRRSPEIIHGLGNILQNAMQFARQRVVVRIEWSASHLKITVTDDGRGFSSSLLNRIGEPYISSREEVAGHMGLGIFIAQTLLERTGAEVLFTNSRGGGAQVVVSWRPPIFEAKN